MIGAGASAAAFDAICMMNPYSDASKLREQEDAARSVRFPCDRLPEDGRLARLLGVYGMSQTGLAMQRVKVHAGRLSVHQWLGLAELARRYTPGYPLHVTTRQDVELHGVRVEDVPAVQHALSELGLTTLGACGDTLRNVTACPESGLEPGTWEVIGVADAVRAAAESQPWIRTLPRKFKISVSGCARMCARPWLNDLGLMAREDDSFCAVVAGSLGPRPGTGIMAFERVSLDEVVPLALAALRLHYEESDRQNRGRARLRHVRERLGDVAFKARLDEMFARARQHADWPGAEAVETHQGGTEPERIDGGIKWPVPRMERVGIGAGKECLRCTRLHLPLGDVEADVAWALGRALEAAGATLRLGFEHDLMIFSAMPVDVPTEMRSLMNGSAVVACPGSEWCTRGVSDSRTLSIGVRRVLQGSPLALVVGISGCPNNCAQAAVADIGLIGRVRTISGSRVEAYRLFAGGDRGMGPALAEELAPAIPASKVMDAVGWLVERYVGWSGSGWPSFSQFVRENQAALSEGLKRFESLS